MGNRFVANPNMLRAKANSIHDIANTFQETVNKVYITLKDIVDNQYLSPEMRSIAREIEACRGDLNNMAIVIGQYGTYSGNAGNTVIRNQENIASSYKSGQSTNTPL